ncbi:MAG: family 43 glycosylhydrolase, partial [Prevotella sp.]|nr:family 43 glycosylhydrolase [Prevotella sp.]
MMKAIKFLLLLNVAFATTGKTTAQTYQNPVLRGVADAGVIRYGGKYYMGGVATMGDFFISNDLTHWDQRKHVYDFLTDYNKGTGAGNNQVHSDDIIYSGGLFHLLFSANYWGKDRHIVHIVHATSPHIEGPYTEVRDDQWMENRIDPQVFCDEDGRLYLYMVKFTDGNTIWARPMNPDFSFAGEARQLFSSQPGTWETMDNRVAEGPFVIKYHGRYYMMYNANHTAAEYGNYRLGVCEADSPMGFNPGGKYSWPVVSPQTERLENTFTDLMRYGGKGYNTIDLNADTIRFTIDGERYPTDLRLKFAQRGGVNISLNGHAIETNPRSDYRLTTIPADWVHAGVNEFTIGKEKGRLVALALYDTSGQPCPFTDGPLLLTPGQPNIVRGPNGWQWWLSYMANEGFRRDQYIDRIHFVNDQLTVDGISGHNTPARQAPARPQYEGTSIDSIPEADCYLLEATARSSEHAPTEVWRIEKNHTLLNVWKDHVKVIDNQPAPANLWQLIRQTAQHYHIDYLSFNEGWDEFADHFSGWQGLTADRRGLSLPAGTWTKGSAAGNYEFSVCFDNRTPDRGKYGVYAAYQDEKNFVKITIDADSR